MKIELKMMIMNSSKYIFKYLFSFFSVIHSYIQIFINNEKFLRINRVLIYIFKIRDNDFFELSLSRPEKISGQSRLSRGTGQIGFFWVQDCPAGLYTAVVFTS
jgi:hypothetical protein